MDLKKARTELLEHRKTGIKDSLSMLNNCNSAIDFWIVSSLKKELVDINEELLFRERKEVKDDC
jgi:hypothetical protein